MTQVRAEVVQDTFDPGNFGLEEYYATRDSIKPNDKQAFFSANVT